MEKRGKIITFNDYETKIYIDIYIYINLIYLKK